MRFKKFLWLLLLPMLVACGAANNGSQSDGQVADESSTNDTVVDLKVGVVSSINEDIWQSVADRLTENGSNINLDAVLFNDFATANTALVEGDIDLNNFQYIPFMYTFNQEQDEEIRPIGFTVVSRLGLFSSDDAIQSPEDIPENAELGMNEDAVSIGYILNFLDANGLIKLGEDASTIPTEDDIVENPKNIQFNYMPAAQLPRALPDLDLAVSVVSYFVDAGLGVDDAIILEDPEQTPPEYFLSIAVRADQLDNPYLKEVVDAYMTAETDEYAETINPIYTPVWQQNIDANKVYEEYVLEQENK
jgi:D-methionine transport system substrate-binding protein